MFQDSFSRLALAVAFAIISFTLVAPDAQARQELSGTEIKSLVTGNRIFLKVPLGGEFPLRYSKNGTVSGDGSSLGLGKYMAPKETGRWWVQNDQLCQQWKSWYKGQVACFRLYETGENSLHWKRNDGRSGRARLAN